MLRRHLAFQLAQSGYARAARREIEIALPLLSGHERARSQVHVLEIHRRSRTADPATHRRLLANAARGLRVLSRARDGIWEARLLHNRGALFFDRGELDRAESDFRRARDLFGEAGAELLVVNMGAALAQISLLQGRIVDSLKALDRLELAIPRGEFSHEVSECRVLALTQARLLPEARIAAEEHMNHFARLGLTDYLATAMLDAAAIALMSGDPTATRGLASRAARSFAGRGEEVNAALARTMLLRARLAEGAATRASVRGGLGTAALLDTAGWLLDASRTRLVVARLSLERGDRETARRQVKAAQALATRGTTADRIDLSHARALLAIADGDRYGAERELRRGLQLVDDFRSALGAVELRATASGTGVELAKLGLALAFESGRPERILEWAERLRGNAMRLPPVRPPGDAKLSRLQAELRRLSVEPGPGGDPRKARLEAAIRDRARLVEADGGAYAPLPKPAEAATVLGDRVLVEYVELDGRLHALTLADGRLALHELGAEDAETELDWLRFALTRLARAPTAADRSRALEGVGASAATLDALLVEPVLSLIGDAPLVLVPTGPLHALPWAALPSLRGRPLVVTPSLSVWVDLAGRPRSRRRKIALVSGPRLRHSAREVKELAALHPGATVLRGKKATARAALAALDGAALAHLACHGHFRADSPLFSSLELADGPLNVYDLQRLQRAPETVVLSACDLAVSGLHPGDELLGLAAALLGMGTRTIVASVVPVPDAVTRRLMIAFHRHLGDGGGLASALAAAQARVADAGFVCLGNG
jgi:tetratricopeptide (TPR) repeat protein